ncbi:MAG: Mov34/MPN/PAD-1 family protein [Candidatus Promineifilaceae bacterium]|jgi:proteasome lid subunit RPN8/RPN11
MTSASTYSEQEPPSEPQLEDNHASSNVVPRDSGIEMLPERQPPGLEEECLLHGQDPLDGEVTVFLSQLALKQIATHSYSDLEREVGGALLGRAYQYDTDIYLDVRAAIPAVTADHGPVHFTFTADAWSQLHKDRARRYPDLDIVGWFHTHPNLGVFYSSDDVVVHSAAFTMPWHVGMVVDPLRKETSFFGWRHKQLVPIAGFYERMELEPTSVLEWNVVPTDVWDHPYEYRGGEQYGSGISGVYLPANSPPAVPALATYVAYGLAALGLLLTVVLLFGWVMPLTREVDRLQNMVVGLADVALADSNAALCPDPRLRILSPLAGQRFRIGERVDITGTALLPDVNRYQVDARPAAMEGGWTTVDSYRGSTKLGQLALWDTESWPPGAYDLRLIAVDNNNIKLTASPNCQLGLELTP